MALRDDLIKHQVFVQRLAGTEHKAIRKDLKALAQAAKNEAAVGTSGKFLKEALRNAISGFADKGLEAMTALAEYEASFSAKLFNKYLKADITTPDTSVLINKLKTNNMEINNLTRGGTRKSLYMAYKQFGNKKADELAQLIKDGQLQNLTASQIGKLIDEKVNGLQNTQARSLAKTNVNYTTNVARSVTLIANKPTFDKVIWVSVLDSGTTDYCEEHDGRIYPVDEGPRPPAHWGCRSYVEPYTGDSNDTDSD
jgi:SPP1 gp7 family putative phage head morphogenesis protein